MKRLVLNKKNGFQIGCLKKKKNADWDQSNKGKSWTDEELKVVLSFAPTKENCLRFGKIDGKNDDDVG